MTKLNTALYTFQQDYFNSLLEKHSRNFIYDMDTGTGKTIMALNHWLHFYPTKNLLIIAPASKVKTGDWDKAIDEFAKDHCQKNKPLVNVISYNKMAKEWKNYKYWFVVFDECHRIKNSTGVWGRSAYHLSRISNGFVGLSATPLPNSWIDSVNYFKMFGLLKNKTMFLNNYCEVVNHYGYNEIVGYRNETRLLEFWQKISIRLSKEEALDLPSLTFKTIYFHKPSDYTKILKSRVVGKKVLDTNMGLRHYLKLNSSLKDRTDWVVDFASNTSDNIIVFCNYKDEIECLLDRFLKIDKEIYIIDGKNKDFVDQAENSVTLVNYKAGSEAVNLSYAPLVVYFSPSDNYAEFYQSHGRTHRIGQTKKITAYKLVVKGTIFADVYQALDDKQDFNFKLWYKGLE